MDPQATSPYEAALRRMEPRPSPMAAAAIALLPLLGVLMLDWSVASLFGFYWIESVAIGLFHGFKLFAARGRIVDLKLEQELADNPALTAEQRRQQIDASQRFQHRLMPGLFFIHYGLFCAAHVAIIVFLFDGAFASLSSALGLTTLAAIVVAQAMDYLRFRADPELLALPRNLLFMLPYKRVIVLQLVLILGAIPLKAGFPLATAILLTATKLVVEFGASLPRQLLAADAQNADRR